MASCTTLFDHAYVFKIGSRVDDQNSGGARNGIRFVVSRGSMSLSRRSVGCRPTLVSRIRMPSSRISSAWRRYRCTASGAMTQIALAPCSPFSVTSTG